MAKRMITVVIEAEGFDSHDEAVLAVCGALDWFNDYGPEGEYLSYETDYRTHQNEK